MNDRSEDHPLNERGNYGQHGYIPNRESDEDRLLNDDAKAHEHLTPFHATAKVDRKMVNKAKKIKRMETEMAKNTNKSQYFGLNMYPKINEPYGLDYQGTDEASCYSGYLSCCGSCARGICFTCACCGCGPIMQIEQGQIGLATAFGRFVRKLGPGLHTYNPCTENIVTVDIRTQTLSIPPQDLITKDNITVKVHCFVVCKVVVPELAIFRLENYGNFISYTTMGTIKTIVAGKTLTELLSKEDEIEAEITEIIDKQTDPFGIDVFSIEMRKIEISSALVSALATIALSEKQMESKVIAAKGNFLSAQVFREAADELSKNPLSLQLHYFETLRELGTEKHTSITLMPDKLIDLFM